MKSTHPKEKSKERFEQNNHLARAVARTLRKPSHIAALWMFWTYADEKGRFKMSAGLLGQLLGVSSRAAQKIMTEMREDGVIRYLDGKANNGIANRFAITWKPRNHSSEASSENTPKMKLKPTNNGSEVNKSHLRTAVPKPTNNGSGNLRTTVPTNRTEQERPPVGGRCAANGQPPRNATSRALAEPA